MSYSKLEAGVSCNVSILAHSPFIIIFIRSGNVNSFAGFMLIYCLFTVCCSAVYLDIAAGLFEFRIIDIIEAIANCKFGNIFGAVWSTLYGNATDISNTTQINGQLLFKI